MKAIVVEDSRLARQGLVRMLNAFPEIYIAGAAESVSDALVLVKEHQPELIFLDIHMPEENGFDLLAQMTYQPKVIFTTAFSEYAIESFEHNTVDYLLKPISKERLATAVAKLLSTSLPEEQNSTAAIAPEPELESGSEPLNEPVLAMNSRIFVKDGDKCHLLELSKIDLIESCKNYVQVFWTNENNKTEKAFIKKSLSQVEARLPTRDFFRANRQFIINLHQVIAIEENIKDGFDVSLKNNRLVDISRRNVSKLKELLSF